MSMRMHLCSAIKDTGNEMEVSVMETCNLALNGQEPIT